MLDRSRGKNRDRELSDIDSSQRIEPYQPHPKCIPTQVLSNRVLYFQERWYKEFPWLHCVALQKGVLCFHCRKVSRKTLTLCSKSRACLYKYRISKLKKSD